MVCREVLFDACRGLLFYPTSFSVGWYYTTTTGLIRSRGLSFIISKALSMFSNPLNLWVSRGATLNRP